jgi:hypothetical protein
MGDTWDEGGDYASKDTVTADIYETWLEKT